MSNLNGSFCIAAFALLLIPAELRAQEGCRCVCNGAEIDVARNRCNSVCQKAQGMAGHWVCPPKPKPHHQMTLFPRYQVVGLLYAPPGIGSEVDYSQGSSFGTHADIKNMFKSGVSISLDGELSIDNEDMVGAGSGSSVDVTVATDRAVGLTSQVDAVDHTKDTFMVLVNPALTLDATEGQPRVHVTYSTNGSPPNLVLLTVAELKDPNRISGAAKRAAIADFKPSDFAAILALDPLADSDSTVDPVSIDPRRYQYTDSYKLAGPGSPDEPVFNQAFTVHHEKGQGSSISATTSVDFAIGAGGGFDFFGLKEELKVQAKMSWEYENTQEKTASVSNTATLRLETPTVNFYNNIDVYFDLLFNCFVFRQQLPPSQSIRSRMRPSLEVATLELPRLPGGTAHPRIGVEVAIVNEATGKRLRAVSDVRGAVAVYGLTPGRYTISSLGMVEEATVAAGAVARATLRLSPP